MSDLGSEMSALAARLGPPPGDIARRVMFVAAEPGEGTSTLARAYAVEAAITASGPVWLIELDLMRGEQHDRIRAEPDYYGQLGDPVRASPDQSMFFTLQPAQRPGSGGDGTADSDYLTGYRVNHSWLYVTRFRRELLAPGQSVHILADGGYWQALAARCEHIVVDAPAWSRSRAASVVAPFMDANLMVVSADRRNPAAGSALRDGLESAGGRWAGVVVNRAPKPPPGLLRGLVR